MIKDTDIRTYIENPHVFGHLLGYNDLIELHSEWIINAWLRKDKRALQAHRNSFKTTSILIVGCIWYLIFFDPNITCLIVRKAETDARKIVLTIRNHFESELVLAIANYIYKVTELKSANWSTSSISLKIKESKTPEGNIEAKGTTSAITGSHYDFIFPDDIITLGDRVSKAEREWTKIFVGELTNIEKEGGKIFYSGTPWHKDDAWSILPKPDRYPIGTIPIKGYKDDLDKKKNELKIGLTSSLYAANYELVHIADEGRIFPEPEYGEWEESIRPIAWLDPKFSGDHTTSLTLIGSYVNDKKEKTWMCRGWVWSNHVVDLYDTIVGSLIRYKAGTLNIEINADQGACMRDLSRLYPSVAGYREKMNKHNKIIAYGKNNFHKIIFAEDCQSEYMNQILDYQEGQLPDDAPDGFSSLLRELGFSGGFNFEAIGPDGIKKA